MLALRLLWDKVVGEFVAAVRHLDGLARFVLVGASDLGNPASVREEDIAAWQEEGWSNGGGSGRTCPPH